MRIDPNLISTAIQELRYAAGLQEPPTEADRTSWESTATKLQEMLQKIEEDPEYFSIAELPKRARYDTFPGQKRSRPGERE